MHVKKKMQPNEHEKINESADLQKQLHLIEVADVGQGFKTQKSYQRDYPDCDELMDF
jgi:hypothetical protein